MSRNLLHKSKLPAFRDWLTEQGIQHRPPRGDYEVLQVRLKSGAWHCVFDRHDSPEHYTVAKPLEQTVCCFIVDTRVKS